MTLYVWLVCCPLWNVTLWGWGVGVISGMVNIVRFGRAKIVITLMDASEPVLDHFSPYPHEWLPTKAAWK